MCDQSCMDWGQRVLTEEKIKGKRIIEIGSLDVNGSFRPIAKRFEPACYVGIDLRPGKGVDVVCKAEEITQWWGKEQFDVAITTNTFEHIEYWKEAISNLKNIVVKGGYIFFEAPSVWPLHEFPHDHWRYSKEDVEAIFEDCEIEQIEYNSNHTIINAVIRKPEDFIEKNLSEYKLFNINTGVRQ